MRLQLCFWHVIIFLGDSSQLENRNRIADWLRQKRIEVTHREQANWLDRPALWPVSGPSIWRSQRGQPECNVVVPVRLWRAGSVDGVRLRSGTTKSCGCLRRELSKKRVRQNDQFQHYVGQTDQLTTKKGVAYSSVRQSSRNKSGVVGVSFDKQTGKWFARLMVHKHYVLMKSFPTMGEAIEARKEAERVYLK